ncbi:hypothetical protein [Microbulbifer hydrolyticus]|uniref:Restriction endonuclease n=1 Tax=Microbulbifer hydrolyticus TaxID=48074 RepID=A0A6P1TDY5_9GAMM|nr:hypothetical protein [Microbulbifer hydrolyticus]MBB5212622.1 hypothetical protein [Microbulbifer hydrolyticus]QHQ40227.1 hypothetical protein GTQ55_15405 [Microbulbifer hydrolyticus]
MQTQDVIRLGREHLRSMSGHVFDVLEVKEPISPDAAVNLSKVISKLSPLVGNMIEFNSVEFLNDQEDFHGHGIWQRQDPGFPDTIFQGVTPTPGFEIKAWFPLATEITARFKDSQNHFAHDQTHVAMLAWLPEQLIFGKPKILGVCVVSGLSVAQARDNHYHNPPDYLVLEPEDTASRTQNLQQTNTNGYKFQGTQEEFREAQELVASWGPNAMQYSPTPEYQERLRELIARFRYRLDTNFAKMDRIVHPGIEEFKTSIYRLNFHGKTVGEWNKLLGSKGRDEEIRTALQEHLGIREEDAEELLL